jgi:hypothetical protein
MNVLAANVAFENCKTLDTSLHVFGMKGFPENIMAQEIQNAYMKFLLL